MAYVQTVWYAVIHLLHVFFPYKSMICVYIQSINAFITNTILQLSASTLRPQEKIYFLILNLSHKLWFWQNKRGAVAVVWLAITTVQESSQKSHMYGRLINVYQKRAHWIIYRLEQTPKNVDCGHLCVSTYRTHVSNANTPLAHTFTLVGGYRIISVFAAWFYVLKVKSSGLCWVPCNVWVDHIPKFLYIHYCYNIMRNGLAFFITL